MLIHGHGREGGVGEQDKFSSPGRKMLDLLIERSEKWAVNPFGQPLGFPRQMGLIAGKEKVAAL